jgi:hypothetical protein
VALLLVCRVSRRAQHNNTGKSSLVQSFGPSLNAVIMQYVDPEILVRFVKQNLNKKQEIVRLELDLRPNNNDMSVMSIIQSRRMTHGQSKPGLVVVGFEEMPCCEPNRDPDQSTTCQLISQRFAGRKGEYMEGSAIPKNSANRGISGDSSIVPIFTSNYVLEETSAIALRKLRMFQQLCVVPMHAISGQDRANFAKQYVSHCLVEKGWTADETASIILNINVGEGDTRRLVRQIRMIAFYLNNLKHNMQTEMSKVVVSQVHDDGGYIIQGGDGATTTMVELQKSDHGNLLAKTTTTTTTTATSLCCRIDHETATSIANQLHFSTAKDELTTILSFWLENTLAPTVIVTQNGPVHQTLVLALLDTSNTANSNVKVIPSVDASQYKMMKSLYDDCCSATNNLKDDIMALGGGDSGGGARTLGDNNDPSCFVAVELICPTIDSQLCIREMIEDSPSQTAFSSNKSALHKNGLLFVVLIQGDIITPEIRSRASLIL